MHVCCGQKYLITTFLHTSMGKCMVWIYSWTAILLSSNTYALYFYLDEGGEKCFLQELADETLIVANYRCTTVSVKNAKDDVNSEEHGMMVEIQDPYKRTVLSRMYRRLGRFSYKSHEPGVHTICLHTKTDNPLKGKIKIDFDLQVGEDAINRSAETKRMHLTDIEARYKQLVERAAEINKETDYLRYREEMFRETTETLSRRVLLWMIGETALLVIMAIWQLENLRKFFESKKLV